MRGDRGPAGIALPFAILLGPLALWRRSRAATLLLVLLVLLLTALTQVGGLLLWLLVPPLTALHGRCRGGPAGLTVAAAAFLLCHLAVSLLLLPQTGRWSGRQPLPCLASEELPLRAASPLFCALNRNYAAPRVHALLRDLARSLAARHPGTVVSYLDAGFPLLDGFPMPPHLSHRNGRAVDLAFFYREAASGRALSAGGAWPLGYWAYSQPAAGEPRPCAGSRAGVSLRWDLDWLQPVFAGLRLDEERSAAMLAWLAGEGGERGLRRILLEPHLRVRFGLSDAVVRFQGCRAARHDDHAHIELK